MTSPRATRFSNRVSRGGRWRVTTVRGCLIPVDASLQMSHASVQGIEASLQLANLRSQSFLQCRADILNHAHTWHFTVSAEATVGSFGIHHGGAEDTGERIRKAAADWRGLRG